MRPKHWIKNILIFAALIFSGRVFESNALWLSVLSPVLFCLTASCVYILNDLRDVESDKKHPTKKHRPIANGSVSIKNAYILLLSLVAIIAISSIFLFNTPYPILIRKRCYI
ncbi:UbiA family prenyltransferase [Treponema sp. R6D11]